MRQLISYLLGFVLISTLATSSCATHKQLTAPPAPASLPTSGGRSEQPLDSVIVAREPNLFDKLLRRTPEPWVVQPIVASRPIDIGNGPAPRKCKGCTFNLVTGNQTVAGKKAQVAAGDGAVASVVQKKAGPAVVASDSSTQNAILGGGNLAAVHGDGNQLEQTKADVEPPSVGATIAKAITTPVGYAVALVVVAGVVYGIVLWRKKKAVETLV
jgi:hypothetical protein